MLQVPSGIKSIMLTTQQLGLHKPCKASANYLSRHANRTRFDRSALFTLLLGLAGFATLPTPTSAVVQNIIPFEWSMPDRLLENTTITNYDPASPIPQYDPNALMLPPGGWTVQFDACKVTSSAITSYEWFVDGVAVATVAGCRFSHQFPREDKYHLSLKVTDEAGDSAILEQDITVQDWLIIALGDSYGSGEGNPEKPVTAQAYVDFSILFDLAANVQTDLQSALNQLPGLEDAQQAAQQIRDDALVTRNQAAADLARLQQDLQDLIVIQTNVENYPAVTAARNNVTSAQQAVNAAQAKVNADQADYDNCSFGNCVARLAILLASQAELTAAQANLVAAHAALVVARDAAIVIYSAISTIQSFSALNLAIDAKTVARNLAQNTYNTVNNAYQNAANSLQQAIAAVASLQSIITDLQQAWEQAKINAQMQYLDHLPVWTSTPPSWGTPEPTYADIVLNGATPGEALRCHRSMISGQARAALAIEKADPHTSVTLVHLACSGAKIDTGLIGDYEGQDVSSVLDPLLNATINSSYTGIPDQTKIQGQIAAAATKVLGREVDAIIISIGGNDIKFADMITECVTGEPCHIELGLPPVDEFSAALKYAIEQNCRPVAFFNQLTGLSLPTGSFPFSDKCLSVYNTTEQNLGDGAALRTFTSAMPGLAAKWQSLNDSPGDSLANSLTENFPSLDTKRVYLTEYPNPTGDDAGNYCGWDPTQTTTASEQLKNLPGVTQPEMIWADTTVATALRDATETAAALHQWTFITETGVNGQTISSVSKKHGYCANDHWVVTIPESLVTQQDPLGVVHPNRKGHTNYQQAIYAQLVKDFYPNGVGITVQAHSNGSSSYFSEGGYNAYATFNVKLESGASTPSGPLTFSSSKTRRKIASTGITSLSATGKTAVITGPCTLNGVAGYSFTATVGDNATPGTWADTFAITVTRPNGFTYTASGTIKSGDYTVSQ